MGQERFHGLEGCGKRRRTAGFIRSSRGPQRGQETRASDSRTTEGSGDQGVRFYEAAGLMCRKLECLETPFPTKGTSFSSVFIFNFYFISGLIYNVLVSGVQRSNLVIHAYIFFSLFHIYIYFFLTDFFFSVTRHVEYSLPVLYRRSLLLI